MSEETDTRKKIKQYRSPGGTPSASNMEYGEIAVSYEAGNETLSIKNTDDEIATFPNRDTVEIVRMSSSGSITTTDKMTQGKTERVVVINTSSDPITLSVDQDYVIDGNGYAVIQVISNGSSLYTVMLDYTAVAPETTVVSVAPNDGTIFEDEDTGDDEPPVEEEDKLLMDVLFYNTSTSSISIVDKDEWSVTKYPSGTYLPIGIVVDAYYESGTTMVMSLTERGNVAWRGYDTNTNLTDFDKVAVTGTTASPTAVVRGVESDAYLPSDNFSAVVCPGDTVAYYNESSTSLYAAPSPYGSGYSSTLSPSSTANALSDLEGLNNTAYLATIGSYEAVEFCDSFSTSGTSQGDWYLPACGEFGYVVARLKAINDTIDILRDTYGTSVATQVSGTYLTSTEFSSQAARTVITTSGGVGNISKNIGAIVRPFILTDGTNITPKPTYTYSDLTITSFGYPTIPSSGGTVSPVLTYTQIRTGIDGSTLTIQNESGATISYVATFLMSNTTLDTTTGIVTTGATTTTSLRRVCGVEVTVSINGQTATATVDVNQEAADVTYEYGEPEVTLSYDVIPSAGGTVMPTISYTQIMSGTDGTKTEIVSGGIISYSIDTSNATSTSAFRGIDSESGAVTVDLTQSTVLTTVGTVTATVTLNGVRGTGTYDVQQKGNVLSYVSTDVSLSYDNMPTAGGTISPTYSYTQTWSGDNGQTTNYTGSNEKAGVATLSFTMSSNVSYAGVNASTGVVTASAANTETSVKNLGTVTLTVTNLQHNGSASSVIYQEAATETIQQTYSDIDITSFSYENIPSSGGNTSPVYSYTQYLMEGDTIIATYTGTQSSPVSGASVTFGFSANSNATSNPSMNTSTGVVSANSTDSLSGVVMGTATITVALNGKSSTKSCYVYQQYATLDMEVVMYDGSNLITVGTDEQVTSYNPDHYTPVGIVFDYEGGGSVIVSLVNMNPNDPDNGGGSVNIYLGNTETPGELSGVTYYPTVGVTGTIEYPDSYSSLVQIPQDEADSGTGYLPSDSFSGVASGIDRDVSYFWTQSPSYYEYYTIPSPNGTNTLYGHGANDCLSGGGSHTAMLNAATAQTNWKTDSSITNTNRTGYWPAACCCWRFHTEGTSQGSWYLPPCGEFGRIVAKLEAINNTISKLNSAFSTNFSQISGQYSTSTISEDGHSWFVNASNGEVVQNFFYQTSKVRAICVV